MIGDRDVDLVADSYHVARLQERRLCVEQCDEPRSALAYDGAAPAELSLERKLVLGEKVPVRRLSPSSVSPKARGPPRSRRIPPI